MKKIFIFIFLLSAFYSNAQFPVLQSMGSSKTQVYSKGSFGSDSGYVFRNVFSDTSQANLGFLKNIANLLIPVGEDFWKRSNDATRWVKIGGIYKISSGYGLTQINDSTAKVDSFLISTKLNTNHVTDSLGKLKADKATTLTINGDTKNLSANQTWNVGTLVAGDTVNKWVGSLYRRGDSVFYKKGSTELFAFKDSTGSGTAPQVKTSSPLFKDVNDSLNATVPLKSLISENGTSYSMNKAWVRLANDVGFHFRDGSLLFGTKHTLYQITGFDEISAVTDSIYSSIDGGMVWTPNAKKFPYATGNVSSIKAKTPADWNYVFGHTTDATLMKRVTRFKDIDSFYTMTTNAEYGSITLFGTCADDFGGVWVVGGQTNNHDTLSTVHGVWYSSPQSGGANWKLLFTDSRIGGCYIDQVKYLNGYIYIINSGNKMNSSGVSAYSYTTLRFPVERALQGDSLSIEQLDDCPYNGLFPATQVHKGVIWRLGGNNGIGNTNNVTYLDQNGHWHNYYNYYGIDSIDVIATSHATDLLEVGNDLYMGIGNGKSEFNVLVDTTFQTPPVFRKLATFGNDGYISETRSDLSFVFGRGVKASTVSNAEVVRTSTEAHNFYMYLSITEGWVTCDLTTSNSTLGVPVAIGTGKLMALSTNGTLTLGTTSSTTAPIGVIHNGLDIYGHDLYPGINIGKDAGTGYALRLTYDGVKGIVAGVDNELKLVTRNNTTEGILINQGVTTHTHDANFNAQIYAPFLTSGAANDSVMVWHAADGKLKMRDAALFGGSGSGTVTSVATNDGSGITGGTITTTGTLVIDTANKISTILQVQHRIDSLAGTISGGGVTTVGTFDASSQTNGATISGSTITFGPADATTPGMVSINAQTWTGAKSFGSSSTGSGPTLISWAGAEFYGNNIAPSLSWGQSAGGGVLGKLTYDAGHPWILAATGANLKMGANNAVNVVISSTGMNVGSTGVPDSTLTVQGSIHNTTGVRFEGLHSATNVDDSMMVVDASSGVVGYKTTVPVGWQQWGTALVATTNNTTTTAATITLPSDASGILIIYMVGIKSDATGTSITGQKFVHWKTVGSTATLLATPTDTEADFLQGFTTATWTVDANAGTLRVRVTGEAATNINWSPTYQLKYLQPSL